MPCGILCVPTFQLVCQGCLEAWGLPLETWLGMDASESPLDKASELQVNEGLDSAS